MLLKLYEVTFHCIHNLPLIPTSDKYHPPILYDDILFVVDSRVLSGEPDVLSGEPDV